VPRADPAQPWPGQLPDPSPTVLLDDPVEVLDVDGKPVRVTSRGMLSTDPARLKMADSPTPLVAALLPAAGRNSGAAGRVSWWAGPWPVDERWWDAGHSSTRQVGLGRTARMQVLLEALSEAGPGCAMLLCYRQRRWYLEGVYE
jgi:protein ImuB